MSYQREFKKRLNIGIVGAGSHCYRNILPAMNYLPVNIKAICDVNIELAAATAKQYGNCNYYSNTIEMYEKETLDAVFIAVSPMLHPKLACEAFDAGLHVWIEKPVSVLACEVEEMINHRKDKIAVVGFKKAFMPSTQKAIEVINSEKYGNLKSILGVYSVNIPENGREALEKRAFTGWLANGCHPLSLMLATGGKVKYAATYRSAKNNAVCILEFENGVIGNLHMASGPQPAESYSFYGDNWHLNIDNCYKVTLERGIPFQYGVTTSYVPEGDDSGAIVWRPQNCLATLENKALFTQGIYDEMMYFCNCVLEGKPAEKGSLEFALELMKVYEACLLSDGNKIEIQ